MPPRLFATACAGILVAMLAPTVLATEVVTWSIPVAGNAFRTKPGPGSVGLRRDGQMAWADAGTVVSIYVHVDRAADLDLVVRGRDGGGPSTMACRAGGKEFTLAVDSEKIADHAVGRVSAKSAGYIRVDFQGMKRQGPTFAAIEALKVSSATEDLKVDFVRDNRGGMFYWGRRGPSVHLRYEVPRNKKLQYAYSEVTVPRGEDPIGSFFMANGFGEGYFGFQVNSSRERRILFSVWSPFRTNNPKDIPKDQRIVALARGPGVHIGEFGNEGSGGQSYLRFPWKSGKTYRFLTEVKPVEKGQTVYTCWFGEKQDGDWKLIASFRRPKTSTHLRGFHSFLESFSPEHGFIGRRAHYGNVWVGDVTGAWHECTRARFSVDPTGGGRHRLDFNGGTVDGKFFLRNCGFFNETGRPGSTFARDASGAKRPEIDVAALPRK